MTEEQAFCNRFEKECKSLRSDKIMLYGAGEKTEFLLKNVKDFDFQGILDPQLEGEHLYGAEVFPLQAAADRNCIIIIVARDHIIPIIYDRIHLFCEENGIKIYDFHGNRLPHKMAADHDMEYWNVNEERVREILEPYPIVSFDIFDTLIQRTTLTLEDMYQLMEMEGVVPGQFAVYRRKAERECAGICNISDIYDKIGQITGWKEDALEEYCRAELKMEKRVLQPRREMIRLLQWAIASGKKVYLVSDMYWPSKQIIEMLHGIGVNDYQQILISCEEQKSKKNGELFEELKKLAKTDQIIHVGDNRYDDIRMAYRQGVNAVQIMSAYELLMLSDMKELLNRVRTLQDRVVLGMIMTKLFANPFSLQKHKGLVYIEDRNIFAYCFVCPIIYTNRKDYIEYGNSIIPENYSEFQKDLTRICGKVRDCSISEKFQNALNDWVCGHSDRIEFPKKELVNIMQQKRLE